MVTPDEMSSEIASSDASKQHVAGKFLNLKKSG